MYRPNVCIVITNEQQDKVLMFHRIGVEKEGWQFPQGGVDAGETENEAFYRELQEEIGTNDVTILKISKKRVKYKFPKWVFKKWKKTNKKKLKYKGQQQRWYLVRLNQGTTSISFEEHPAEFDAFEWVPVEEAVQRIITFKQKAYAKGLQLLEMIH